MCALRACGNLCLLNETDMVEQHCDNLPLLRIFIKMSCRCVNSQFIILRREKPAVLAEIKKKGPRTDIYLLKTEKEKKKRI